MGGFITTSFEKTTYRGSLENVADGNDIYFIVGVAEPGTDIALRDAEGHDVSKNKWDKIAEIHEARKWACGAAEQGQIYIAGGVDLQWHFTNTMSKTCEVYKETTDEWQFIASLRGPQNDPTTIVCVDGTQYVLGGLWSSGMVKQENLLNAMILSIMNGSNTLKCPWI